MHRVGAQLGFLVKVANRLSSQHLPRFPYKDHQTEVTYSLKLSGKEQQVEPRKRSRTSLVEPVRAIALHRRPKVLEGELVLWSVVRSFTDQGEVQPNPILRRRRDLCRLLVQLESSHDLVQRVLELIDAGVRAHVPVEVAQQGVTDLLRDSSVWRGDIGLEGARERPVGGLEVVLVRRDELKSFFGVTASDEVIRLSPNLDTIDGLLSVYIISRREVPRLTSAALINEPLLSSLASALT